ncbi:MAG: YhcH/YjgK/YiaL family protein [Monoglobales bacterium]
MIFDNIKNAEKYCSLNPEFRKVFEHIKECVEKNTPPSRYEFGGMKVLIQEYDTFIREDNDYECHKEVVDIQFIQKGQEEIRYCDPARMELVRPYNADIDCAVYKGPEKYVKLYLTDGDFVCFFPGEAHYPSVAVDGKPSRTRKIVIKVKHHGK